MVRVKLVLYPYPFPDVMAAAQGVKQLLKTTVLLEEKLDYLIILAIINFIDHFLQVLFSL